MERDKHWNQVYRDSEPSTVSWYQPRLELSLELIEQAGVSASAGVLDVGSGASTLAGDLLDRGFHDVTMLDCSSTALEQARCVLGERADQVRWLEGDITELELPASRFDLWHDRAVFHFLTEKADRAAYCVSLERALRPGSHVVLATFAMTGPERCSGLPIVRYDADALQRELCPGFHLATALEEAHRTPSGKRQDFLYCRFRKD